MVEQTAPNHPAPHLDGCPSCIVNVEEPTATRRVTHGFTCSYRCTDCGHTWTTAWWGGSD